MKKREARNCNLEYLQKRQIFTKEEVYTSSLLGV
jgi:hypothetical protein